MLNIGYHGNKYFQIVTMALCYKPMPLGMDKISSAKIKFSITQLNAWAGKIMTILFRKTTITLELLELWTPNKHHLVPYSQTNRLIPNLNS